MCKKAMLDTADQQNIQTENLVAAPSKLIDLLFSFQRSIHNFRINNKDFEERNLNILNDLEDYIRTQFRSLELPFYSPTCAAIAAQNAHNTSEEINNCDSLELDANISHESHYILRDEIEKIQQNNINGGQADDPEVIDHCNTGACSEQHTLNSSKVRPFSQTAAFYVPHKLEDDIFHFSPSQEQWSDFKEFLRVVKSSKAVDSGVCKITIPGAGVFREENSSFPTGSAYRTQIRTNGTIAINLTLNDAAPLSSLVDDISNLTTQEAVDLFEKRIKQRSGLKDTRYCSDINAKCANERSRLGLPLISPIWPLRGDNLARTRARVPGLHFPYAYKANASFGAVFAAHKEDYDLFSINHLYRHRKVWIVIPPSAANLLESVFRESVSAIRLSHCAQFIRHYASYLRPEVLDRWNVPYKIVQQNAGEAMLIFPKTYHQGFSVGETVAEAVNYADDDWDPESYAACEPDTCPSGLIDRGLMAIRNPDEDQESASEKESDDNKDQSEGEAAQGDLVGNSRSRLIERQGRGYGGEGVKRKAVKELPIANKRNRNTHRSYRDNIVALKESGRKDVTKVLEEVTSRPTIDGITVYRDIIDLLEKNNIDYDDSRILTLVRLFYAIASPDAICQLHNACQFIRQGLFEVIESTNGILGAIKALDRLDANSHTISIAKRFYLVALSVKRFELQTSLAEPSVTCAKQNSSDELFGRSDTLALTHLMAEAYPHLKPTRACKTQGKDEYGVKHKLMKERLLNGQKWSRLSEAFAPGILALVPTQGEYRVSNKEYARFFWLTILINLD